MLFLYRTIINLTFFFLPIIIIYRILINKEHPSRFLEKIGNFKKNTKKGKLIWFHGSSVGEVLSVIPLIEKLEKRNDIKKILITSNTLSSSKVISKLNLKKTIHQFFPFDTNFLAKKFVENWKPDLAIFIESEIWPNSIINIKKANIPLILLNARITKNTFKKWKKINFFSKNIFKKFDLCLAQNFETKNYLKKLGAINIKQVGNLKFCETKKNFYNKIKDHRIKFLKTKKILFCASSTHSTEEIFFSKVFIELSKTYKDAISIIIPRHIDRAEEIGNDLKKMGLNVHMHSSKNKINKKTEIYLVDSYGETKLFYHICKIVFLGGSLIRHGGQNPLEAARLGCKILHGPNIANFTEVYKLLNQINIATKVKSIFHTKKTIIKNLKNKPNTKKIEKKLFNLGNKILLNNKNEVEKYI